MIMAIGDIWNKLKSIRQFSTNLSRCYGKEGKERMINVTITATMDEKLTEDEYLRLIDFLMQLGMENINERED